MIGDSCDEWRSYGHNMTGESASKAILIAVLSLRPQTEANMAIGHGKYPIGHVSLLAAGTRCQLQAGKHR